MKRSSRTSPRGALLVISGPSGVGKSSVIDAVLERTGARFSISATTRSPRPGEVDGRDYRFVDEATFDDLVHSGGMLEWAVYGGHRYGTPRGPVVEALSQGTDVVLDIENDGAHQVKRNHPSAILVFLMPPSRDELERRLRDRGDTSGRDIERRLGVADEQMADARARYDHLVVNDDLESAIKRVLDILCVPAATEPHRRASGTAGNTAAHRSDTE